ncbi:DDE-type integrase/transposase/recombinase [Ensifer canadensis]|uniref:DDE-type integrase/transposase/recombinase n=1 Tax=Ensifer canadensis TaxID=555315 RepID=UPI0014906858|nr:DDE-type integrase/transposase/recombinase [Ensifer canadensis]
MVAEFLAQEEDDFHWKHERCHRSDEDIERFYAIFQVENEELVEEARVSMIQKGKKKLFVMPRQFRRLIERFEESELNPASMADFYPGGGSPGSTLSQEDLEFTLDFAATARTPDRPTIKVTWQEMKEENARRVKEGLPGYRIVSLTTFQRMVAEGNDFLNDVGQGDSKHRVERKYFFKQQGLQVTRPLQIVEMDEHQVHVMKMFTKNRVWDRLHPDVQVRIEKLGRVWLSTALDAYSRSIVGLKIVKIPNDPDTAVATLAMVAQRKDKISALLGAQTRWSQCGTPEGVHTDAGGGYVAARFEMAVMMYSGRHRIPPSKHPHLRGRIERFFKTLNQRYIHLFSGQTFSNPLMKGEYDPAKYAHLTDEEFADLIARLIVDCYHNTKHRALGMTPLQAWERGSQLANGSILPPPPPKKYREIFGVTIKRSIGNSGIEIAGNIYSNQKLLEVRKKWYRAKLWIRLNEEDISSISVKHKRLNRWIEVPAVFKGLKGVTLTEWKETVAYIERHLGTQSEHSEEVVSAALKDVRKIIALSKNRPGILVHENLEKKLKDIEAGIPANFRYSQQPDYDYGQYDDGIDHEDDPDDDDNEETVTGRMKAQLAQKPQQERVLAPIPAGGNPFNPGAGMTNFDRSGFISEEARKTPRPRNAVGAAGTPRAKTTKEPPPALPAATSAPAVETATPTSETASAATSRKPKQKITIVKKDADK